MLILTRKENESIIINNNIEIKVISSEDGKVKIGIEAPKTIDIYRKEIYDRIQEENINSALEIKRLTNFKKFVKKD
jgi:carbon storage regulator